MPGRPTTALRCARDRTAAGLTVACPSWITPSGVGSRAHAWS